MTSYPCSLPSIYELEWRKYKECILGCKCEMIKEEVCKTKKIFHWHIYHMYISYGSEKRKMPYAK